MPLIQRKQPKHFLHIEDAVAIIETYTVDIPVGLLTCITGVAGSGKSSLIHEHFMREYPDAVLIDQSPIGRTSRANPATFTGVFDRIRKIFAQHTGKDAALFSFNSEGACKKCNGQGYQILELHFLIL